MSNGSYQRCIPLISSEARLSWQNLTLDDPHPRKNALFWLWLQVIQGSSLQPHLSRVTTQKEENAGIIFRELSENAQISDSRRHEGNGLFLQCLMSYDLRVPYDELQECPVMFIIVCHIAVFNRWLKNHQKYLEVGSFWVNCKDLCNY